MESTNNSEWYCILYSWLLDRIVLTDLFYGNFHSLLIFIFNWMLACEFICGVCVVWGVWLSDCFSRCCDIIDLLTKNLWIDYWSNSSTVCYVFTFLIFLIPQYSEAFYQIPCLTWHVNSKSDSQIFMWRWWFQD